VSFIKVGHSRTLQKTLQVKDRLLAVNMERDATHPPTEPHGPVTDDPGTVLPLLPVDNPPDPEAPVDAVALVGGKEDVPNGLEAPAHPPEAKEAAPQELSLAGLSLGSLAVHADDHISAHAAVAPAMHVSTTFRYNSSPADLVPLENANVSLHIPPHLKDGNTTVKKG
jgi:hypothetical protein